MFCKNCGKPLEENATFCGECGTKVELEPVNAEPVAEVVTEPVAEAEVAGEAFAVAESIAPETEMPPEADASDEFSVTDEAIEYDEAPVTRRKRGKFLKIFIPSVAVLLVVAIVLSFTLLKGLVIKTFGSDEQYFQYVQDKALLSFNETYVDDYYAKFLDNLKKDASATTTLDLTVDDSLADLISVDGDISWINELQLVLNQKVTSDKNQINAMLNVSGKDILSIDAIMNLKNNSLYLALPELCETYLNLNLTDLMPNLENVKGISNKDIADAMPSPETVKKLTDKYCKLILSNIEEIEKTSEKVTVGNISQKLTVIEFEINEDTLEEIAKSVIKELKKDDDVKETVKNFEKLLKKSGAYTNEESLYSLFKDYLDEASEVAGDISEEDISLEVSQYINNSHEVIGTVIESDGDEFINSITVRKGTKTATEISIGEELVIEGQGEVKKNIYEGEYEISFEGDTYFKVYVSDYDIKRYEKGELKATYTVEPTDEFFDAIPEEVSDVISVLNPKLEVVIDLSETTSKIEFNVTNGKKTLVGIAVNSKIKDSAKISVPSNSVDITDEDAVNEWFKKLDGEKVISALEKTKLPEEIIQPIKSVLENVNMLSTDAIASLISGVDDSYNESYYDDEYYDDYYDDDYDYDYDYDDYYDYSDEF